MSRLPKPGSDSGTWGDILNDYLSQEHNSDGSQKTLPITKGGTGATDTTTARTNLGAASTTDLTNKADDSTVVHKSGTETITGNKDFTGGATINSTNIVVTSDTRLSDSRTPTDGSVTDAKITSGGLSPSSINGGIISLGETSTTAYRGDRGKIAYDTAIAAPAFDMDTTLSANSDTRVPSQHAVKTYADTKAPASSISPGAIAGTAVVTADTRLRAAMRNTTLGILAENCAWPPGTKFAISAGSLQLSPVFLLAGDVVSNITVQVSVAAVGTAPTLIRLGLYSVDSAGTTFTLRASCSNLKDDARWLSKGWVKVAMDVPYTIPANGIYYCAFLLVGAFGTTAPQFACMGVPNVEMDSAFVGSNYLLLATKPGQTDLTSPITSGLSGNTFTPYFMVN